MKSYHPTRGSLLTATLLLLKESKKSALVLHIETGIPYYWLKKFMANAIPDPSVNRVQSLYEHLAQRKLAV